MTLKISQIIISLLFIVGSLQAQTADTTMTVEFHVTTSSPGGDYSPRNIGAIWIESSTQLRHLFPFLFIPATIESSQLLLEFDKRKNILNL